MDSPFSTKEKISVFCVFEVVGLITLFEYLKQYPGEEPIMSNDGVIYSQQLINQILNN